MKQIRLWWWKLFSNIGYLFVMTANRMISVWPDPDTEVCPNCLIDETAFFSITGEPDMAIHKCNRCGYYFFVETESEDDDAE